MAEALPSATDAMSPGSRCSPRPPLTFDPLPAPSLPPSNPKRSSSRELLALTEGYPNPHACMVLLPMGKPKFAPTRRPWERRKLCGNYFFWIPSISFRYPASHKKWALPLWVMTGSQPPPLPLTPGPSCPASPAVDYAPCTGLPTQVILSLEVQQGACIASLPCLPRRCLSICFGAQTNPTKTLALLEASVSDLELHRVGITPPKNQHLSPGTNTTYGAIANFFWMGSVSFVVAAVTASQKPYVCEEWKN